MATDLRHSAPASRYARATEAADLLLRLENRERYIAQSAATKAGQPAALPARPPVTRKLHPTT